MSNISFDKMFQTHFSKSFLVTYLLVIFEEETNKELHSECVGVSFINRERKRLRGQDQMSYYQETDIGYYLKTNTYQHLVTTKKPNKDIFFTKNQLKKFDDLVIKLANYKFKIDTCVLDLFIGDEEEVNKQIHKHRTDPSSVIWLGEFI